MTYLSSTAMRFGGRLLAAFLVTTSLASLASAFAPAAARRQLYPTRSLNLGPPPVVREQARCASSLLSSDDGPVAASSAAAIAAAASLLAACEGLDRGAAADASAAAAVGRCVTALEETAPCTLAGDALVTEALVGR